VSAGIMPAMGIAPIIGIGIMAGIAIGFMVLFLFSAHLQGNFIPSCRPQQK
jgi:hypothetical protein